MFTRNRPIRVVQLEEHIKLLDFEIKKPVFEAKSVKSMFMPKAQRFGLWSRRAGMLLEFAYTEILYAPTFMVYWLSGNKDVWPFIADFFFYTPKDFLLGLDNTLDHVTREDIQTYMKDKKVEFNELEFKISQTGPNINRTFEQRITFRNIQPSTLEVLDFSNNFD